MRHRQRQRTMAAHRMPGDRLPVQIDGEFRAQKRRQLFRDVIPHAEMRRPRVLRCIDVKACTLAKVIGLVIGHAIATRRRVGENHRNSRLRCKPLCGGLGHGVFMRAGEPGQIPEDGNGRQTCLRRQVEAEGHVAPAGV